MPKKPRNIRNFRKNKKDPTDKPNSDVHENENIIPNFKELFEKKQKLKEKSKKVFENFTLSDVPEEIRNSDFYFDPSKGQSIDTLQKKVIAEGLDNLLKKYSKLRIPISLSEKEKKEIKEIQKDKNNPTKSKEIPGKLIVAHFAKLLKKSNGFIDNPLEKDNQTKYLKQLDEKFKHLKKLGGKTNESR